MMFHLQSIEDQKFFVREQTAEANLDIIQKNLNAPECPCKFDESNYDQSHYNWDRRQWNPPHPHIVAAFFDHFKSNSKYKSDYELADLLHVHWDEFSRFVKGVTPVPYHVWQTFLVISGRKTQQLLEVEIYA